MYILTHTLLSNNLIFTYGSEAPVMSIFFNFRASNMATTEKINIVTFLNNFFQCFDVNPIGLQQTFCVFTVHTC